MAIAQSKIIGQGTTLTVNAVVIGQVKRITEMSESFSPIDVTDLDDTTIQYILSGMQELGDVSIEFFWTPNADIEVALDTLFRARTLTTFIITLPLTIATGKIRTFSGFILSLTPGEVEGKTPLTRTVVVKPTTIVTASGA